jgi:hypothetical protein
MSKPTHRHGCTALQCQQGRTARPCVCPCPQACEVPAPDADPLRDEPATRLELALMAAIAVCALAAVGFLVKACSMA